MIWHVAVIGMSCDSWYTWDQSYIACHVIIIISTFLNIICKIMKLVSINWRTKDVYYYITMIIYNVKVQSILENHSQPKDCMIYNIINLFN